MLQFLYVSKGETMRADRLLSLLMILQTQGRQTAKSLAEELEVSERTIYRDITALSISGVPVYCERGPGGGVELIESYRTNLTGLSRQEVQALFMLSIPAPMMELGVSQEMKAALLKLSAALPSTLKQAEGSVRQRVYIDNQKDEGTDELVPFLHQIYDAVWEDRKLNLQVRYFFGVISEQIVNPYGLVSKGGRWYLVFEYDGNMLVYSLSSFHNIQLLEETFERDPSFNLANFWTNWWNNYGKESTGYKVKLRVFDGAVSYLPWFFGSKIKEVLERSPVDEEGQKMIEISFPSLYHARDRIMGLGRAVEVIEPLALRMSVADYGAQIADLYQASYVEE